MRKTKKSKKKKEKQTGSNPLRGNRASLKKIKRLKY